MENVIKDLFQRIFSHSKTTLEGLALVLVTWLSTNGIDLSLERKGQLIAAAGALTVALYKFLSRDSGGEAK